ncbi:uncharacterized protein HMPREF1541_01485 [Cyphellophora europaea CBS 101466]|uniref:Fe2OG dioxygenase domain-containing protein n=1 Tax=Cyphellophora europaea (strain CBS 101466) TaxID=1220924 RepID=W2S0T7_CYPE1|nr:uncharacterized protein HMPREF1541_01485 [Cyphellophora europaea CBS 101466]ETN42331.1 hypothetical protein HMPREF1541_01485 [Cyphellophora europaea CBS 101466]
MSPPVAVEPYPSGTTYSSKEVTDTPVRATSVPVNFDASKHLAYNAPTNNLQMSDIGLEPSAISSTAATQPFQLLSREAVLAMRREIFSPEVLDNCMHHTRPGSVQIRGLAPRYAPFIHAFWNSAEVLRIMSENAGVDLVPAMDYEISHVNVQLGPDGVDGVRKTPAEPPAATGDAITAFEANKGQKQAVTDQVKPVIEWHKDSHPFVCVVMLSDAQHMVGGETELMGGDGMTLKVKAPQMGCAAILQGRYITHTAAPAANMPERITVVTSFRPKDPRMLDETTNANVRNKSHLTELYYQWTTYRLEVLAQRALLAKKELEERYARNVQESDPEGKAGLCRKETVNVDEVNKWGEEQIEFIRQTLWEMRPLEERNGRIW